MTLDRVARVVAWYRAETEMLLVRSPKRLFGVAAMRIGLGAATCITYLGDWAYRHELYGPDALAAVGEGKHAVGPIGFSVYSWAHSDLQFDIMYLLAFTVSAAFAVVGGRALAAVQLVFVSSLYAQNAFVLDGGDNLAGIVLLFLPFTISSAWLSPLAQRTRRRLSRGSELENAVHNTAVGLIVLQVCLVYLVASLWKISGTDWQHGIAMERVSQTSVYGLNAIATYMLSFALVAVVVTWFVILIQAALPIAVALRLRILPVIVGAVMAMHLGIIGHLGLVSFGVTMIACDCVLLNDAHYEWLRHRLRRGPTERAPAERQLSATS